MNVAVRQVRPLQQQTAQPSAELALSIAWSAHEPHRVGEIALLPAKGHHYYLGRNPKHPDLDEAPETPGHLVRFFRQRPPGVRDRSELHDRGAPCLGRTISRRQLEILPLQHALLVKNIGSCAGFINGSKLTEAPLMPGQTLYLEDNLVLYCTRRPPQMAPLCSYPLADAPFFGRPDSDGLIGESPAVWEARERRCTGAVSVSLPPLKDRREDIPLLMHHILWCQARRNSLDISRYFRNGLPRVHPQLVEQLLHLPNELNLEEIEALLVEALAHRRGGIIGPLPEAEHRAS